MTLVERVRYVGFKLQRSKFNIHPAVELFVTAMRFKLQRSKF